MENPLANKCFNCHEVTTGERKIAMPAACAYAPPREITYLICDRCIKSEDIIKKIDKGIISYFQACETYRLEEEMD